MSLPLFSLAVSLSVSVSHGAEADPPDSAPAVEAAAEAPAPETPSPEAAPPEDAAPESDAPEPAPESGEPAPEDAAAAPEDAAADSASGPPAPPRYRMVPIPPGPVWMGSPDDERRRGKDEGRRQVSIQTPFLIGETEVTEDLWLSLMPELPNEAERQEPPEGTEGYPVVGVTWVAAVTFANALSEREGLTPCYRIVDRYRVGDAVDVTWPEGLACTGYRLLTEAEWARAARGQDTGLYGPTDDPSAMCAHGNIGQPASFRTVFRQRPFRCEDGFVQGAPVGQFRPNAFGVHDLYGNVSTWVWDRYAKVDDTGVMEDPTGPVAGRLRVIRGATWYSGRDLARVADRYGYPTGQSHPTLGLRLARSGLPPAPPPAPEAASVPPPAPESAAPEATPGTESAAVPPTPTPEAAPPADPPPPAPTPEAAPPADPTPPAP